MPKPKDKTSSQWRYWTLRKTAHAFQNGYMTARKQAWNEFEALLKGLMADGDFWHISNALAMMPHLIIARREIDKMNERERRAQAVIKGVLKRRQKGASS